MTEIVRSAGAGTMESSDVYVEIEPGQAGIELRLESVVKGQFGPAIEEVVREVLDQSSDDRRISASVFRLGTF